MVALTDYFLVINEMIQDQARKLTDSSRFEAVAQAVAEHSRIQPIIRSRSLSGTGTYTLGTPTGWDNEFSSIDTIEYPVGQRPPSYLASDAWLLVSSPTATTRYQIQLQHVSPGTAERVNIAWTVPHVVSHSESTIPEGHYRAVATLGASYACLMLAGFYSQQGEPMISIDSQNPGSKARDYMALAKLLRGSYNRFFGISESASGVNSVPAAGVFSPVEENYQWGGDLMAHPRHWRRRR
jgi:hypothetical protein